MTDIRAEFEAQAVDYRFRPSEDAVARELERLASRAEARRRLSIAQRQTPAPEILSLDERLSRPRPLAFQRIVGWQPAGTRVVLAAQYKSGKTTLVANLVRCLVDGDPFLDRAAVVPIDGAVAIFDTEMSERMLEDWYALQGIRRKDRVILIPLRGSLSCFNLLDPASRTEWAGHLRDRGVRYVVLDCLRPVIDSLGLDENRDAGRVLEAFDELLAEAGVSEALVVHHMGHSGERSRGDSRIRDWPDEEWILVRQGDDSASTRFISAYGRDVEVPETQLHYDATSRHLGLGYGSRRDGIAVADRDALISYLGDNPGWHSKSALEKAMSSLKPPVSAKRTRTAISAELEVGGRVEEKSGARGARLIQLVSSSELVQTELTRSN